MLATLDQLQVVQTHLHFFRGTSLGCKIFLADCVSLAGLALQRVLLLLVVVIDVLSTRFPSVIHVLLNVFKMSVDARLVHGHQRLHCHGNVGHE